MSQEWKLQQFIEIENLLNQSSGKRYHFRSGDDWKFSIVEVEKIGNEKIIVDDLDIHQMIVYLKRNLKVTLETPLHNLDKGVKD
jgi:hypothetical protein